MTRPEATGIFRESGEKAKARLVFSSSASVYGNALHTQMGEDHPLNNRTFYGATKIAGEQFLFVEGVLQHQEGVVSIRAQRVAPLHSMHLETHSHDFH